MRVKRWLSACFIGILLLAGCSLSQTEKADDTADKETTRPQEKEQEEKPAEETKPTIDEVALFSAHSLEDLKIKQKSIDNLYDEDGNFPAHTEREMVTTLADDNGLVDIALDDQPVRNITSEDGKINNITNLSDHFIDILKGEALILPEEEIKSLYQVVIQQDSGAIGGYEGDGNIDFRPYEELTNLERGILASIGFTSPLLNTIEEMVRDDAIDQEVYEVIKEQFALLGSPTLTLPAPQSIYDYELFNIMLIIKEEWMQLAQYEDPSQDFDAFLQDYQALREETNNLLAYLFVTIGEIA